jgi:hypothetical protein
MQRTDFTDYSNRIQFHEYSLITVYIHEYFETEKTERRYKNIFALCYDIELISKSTPWKFASGLRFYLGISRRLFTMDRYIMDLIKILNCLDDNNIKWKKNILSFTEIASRNADILRAGLLVFTDNLITVIYLDSSGQKETKEYVFGKNREKLI